MPLARTADLVAAAYQARSGVLACNVITLEHAEAIVAGAESVGRPVILQLSENAVKFHYGKVVPIAAAATAVAAGAAVDVAVHLDHVEDEELLHASAGTGASSVMFDASTLDYAANVAATKAAAEWAHRADLFLEAELGEVGGKDGAHAPGVRTDPGEAADFVAATGVDALAVAVGSSHAMSQRSASLDFDLIRRLRASVSVPLVLHGSSGVSDSDLRKAVEAGITKINVGTLLNVRFTAAVRDHLAADPTVNDPRRYLSPARDAMAEAVATLITAING
ncbi:class II fructose-bisphosphate aldolase [Mycobacterium crocinum]|uniref:Class II fructose-bisphosphate aldolase n=1 Tax=Mycolicibacterium crocinum TaxID=388459 RepID=A0ABY3TDZ1_9MYCO|nr:class II fructose-bisphosphate aldolase [Mycolicibacterium crocinum]MCV7218384.1 class II fructose-bisphosphate aldolase [Mycolicibacterium crocinum]ULN39155.1 class II fructose-bisphosphate aldolase [Mycolicibacterium crocinum]